MARARKAKLLRGVLEVYRFLSVFSTTERDIGWKNKTTDGNFILKFKKFRDLLLFFIFLRIYYQSTGNFAYYLNH